MARVRIHQPWRIAGAIVLIGIMLKILHVSYASPILLIGLAGVLFLYPLHFLKKRKKRFLDYAKLAFVVFWVLHYTFRVFHWNYGDIFTLLAQLSLVVLAIAFLYNKFSGDKETSKTERWETLLYSIAGVCIVLGVILSILHWPYGNFLLILGLVAAGVSVVLGATSSKK